MRTWTELMQEFDRRLSADDYVGAQLALDGAREQRVKTQAEAELALDREKEARLVAQGAAKGVKTSTPARPSARKTWGSKYRKNDLSNEP